MKVKLALGAALLILCGAVSIHAASNDGLSGTNWKMHESGIAPVLMFWRRSPLVFKDGNFMVLDVQKLGYVPAAYAATKIGNGIEWTATLESPKDGKMVWEGRRVGNKMTGSYTWTSLEGNQTRTVDWAAKLAP